MGNNKIYSICFFLFACQMAFGQVNFFTNDDTDSLATGFYQRGKKITVLAAANYPTMQFGAAFFIHNNENKASYYVECKTNGSRRATISGVECHGEGTREKEIAFTATSFNVGLGRGITKNWFLYAGVGVVLKTTNYENEVEDNYRYTVPYNDVWLNIPLGAMYVIDKNFSIAIGTELYDRCINVGFGYTW
ncbi:MAG: hypothetical protein J6X18_09810 [Bacteroidales bacterium]|nr:hypothetical protein [Bacteroidales bacterium]